MVDLRREVRAIRLFMLRSRDAVVQKISEKSVEEGNGGDIEKSQL